MSRTYRKTARFGGQAIVLGSMVASALCIATPSRAALLIGISDLTDGGSASATNGSPSAPPSTSFTLPGGNFGPVANPDVSYSAVQATSDSPGTAGGAEITLRDVDITNLSNVPQTIAITVADTDYAAPGGPGSSLSLFGTFAGTPALGLSGPSSGAVSMSSYADPLDGPNASTSPVLTTTVTSTATPVLFNTMTGSFSGITPTAVFTRVSGPPALYSLAGVTTVTLAPGSVLDLTNNTITFANTVVPEPASLAIFATGSLLLMRRRRASAR
jgi:hypothetical protein